MTSNVQNTAVLVKGGPSMHCFGQSDPLPFGTGIQPRVLHIKNAENAIN